MARWREANFRSDSQIMSDERNELYETYRSISRQQTTTTSFLSTANIALVSIGVNNNSSLIILISSMFSIVMILLNLLFSRIYCSLCFSAMHYAKRHDDEDIVFVRVLLYLARDDLYHKITSISEIDDFDTQLFELKKIKYTFFPSITMTILYVVAAVHIILSFTLWWLFGWPLV
jgi:hypothetical protein